MATISTIPAVKTRLVTLLSAALAPTPVTYAWPGPSTGPEAVFCGRHPELDDIRVDATHELPTIKAGRKQRQETYTVPLTVWTFRPDLSSDEAAACEARAFTLLGDVEDVLAEDPSLGDVGILRATISDLSSTLWPFQKGWACELLVSIEVHARLS